jgi:hypothetical protein
MGPRTSTKFDQDPYQEKYNFTSITRVPIIRIGHMMARLKGLSMDHFQFKTHGHLRLWPTPNPTKVPKFKYTA